MQQRQEIYSLLKELDQAQDTKNFKSLSKLVQQKLLLLDDPLARQKYKESVLKFRRHQTETAMKNRSELFQRAGKSSTSMNRELKETLAMLETEIQKSDANYNQIHESNRILDKTDERFNAIGGLLQNSRVVLNRLVSKDQKDRWFLYSGLCIFVCTCLYIFLRRL
jgi:vacuolar-type H+-ATPase subunit I/STV1